MLRNSRKTHESLTRIDFPNDDTILKIVRNLDPNKAHGHDMISIRMVKICDDSICLQTFKTNLSSMNLLTF